LADNVDLKPELPLVLSRYKDVLDLALKDAISDRRIFLYDMLRYCMGWSDAYGAPLETKKGKGIRPSLCLFTCDALGGDIEKALPAAVSLELIHNFSLIHDEIQDSDEIRHHRPTLWNVWGIPKALVAGNVMRVLADKSMSTMPSDHSKLLTVSSSIVSEACLEMIEGQYMDISFEGGDGISVDQYMKMISHKTGALLRSSVHIGAVIGSRGGRVADIFREIGIKLGFMFQIRDDILGTWGETTSTGKPVGSDIRRKKNTLPIIHARETQPYQEEISELYSLEFIEDHHVDRVLDILDATKAGHYCQGLVENYALEVSKDIQEIGFSKNSKEEFQALVSFLVDRSF
jgi:geranylgeranyl diphosphate synthase type I|tara:strand:+ start:2111 stop:3148 length:1038 start_codon:yes stop_codon:yes gene_type:complete